MENSKQPNPIPEKSREQLMRELASLKASLASEKNRRRKLTLERAETEQRERRRIADLLHDDLQQLLVGARFQLQTFTRRHPESPVLENIAQLLDRSVATTRHLSQQLRSTADSPAGSADFQKQVIQNSHERQAAQTDALSEGGSKKIRVLLADDQQVMRQGLLSIVTGHPRIQVVGEAENGREAVEMARRLRPDVVVMDLNMPEMDGLKATGRLKAELPEVRVIGLSMYEEEEIAIAKAMRLAGAEAYINKSASPDELLKAIDAVGRG
ncbi:MAG: response regulator [Thermodesulfobacteriota bacterium]